jgi:hypothetical protein
MVMESLPASRLRVPCLALEFFTVPSLAKG